MGKSSEGFSQRSVERLQNYDWPGNVRELENVIERALILTGDGLVEIPELVARACRRHAWQETTTLEAGTSGAAPSQALAKVSKAHILRVLEETDWVIAGPSGAAAKLEMKRTTLNFRMKKLGIVRPGASPD